MAKFLANYRYDVFVSYAHVDDILDGKPPGWVTIFKTHIEDRLAQLLGRRDSFDIWMDHDLRHADGVTDQLMQAVSETAVLLVVLSPGYAASEWCRKERNQFLEAAASRSGTRILVVERDCHEDADDPGRELIPDRKRFQFWQRDEEGRPRILGPPVRVNQAYIDRIDDVSRELARALRELRSDEPVASDNVQVISSGPEQPEHKVATVFVAHVTDDLDGYREALMRRLEESGIPVLPHGYYSMDPQAFREAAEKDLGRSQLFVQLLSAIPGKKPQDLPQGYTQLQTDLARAAGIEMLQWRDVELDPQTIADPDHLKLLESPAVRAEPLEDFKVKVIGSATQKRAAPDDANGATNVFVCVGPADAETGKRLETALNDIGVECWLPTTSQDPGEHRQDLKQKLMDCDGLIVAYDKEPLTWVQGRLVARDMILPDRGPLPTAVYSPGGHAETSQLEATEDIAFLDGNQDMEVNVLGKFVLELRK